MPLYMDRHDVPEETTAADVAEAHVRDVGLQAEYGVTYLTYWFDNDAGTVFCLADGPNAEAVDEVHRLAHGGVANKILEVDPQVVSAFLGRIQEAPVGVPYVETAFRAILFTDIEGSTTMTERLGDRQAMELLRAHNDIVRAALGFHAGREVKHTGDGIMAAFPSVSGAIKAALVIQERLAERNSEAAQPLNVRIGLSAGEPVTENDDLFGAAVQLAARICACADPGTILVASVVRDLCIGKGFKFEDRGQVELKGFSEPARIFEVCVPD